MSAATAQLLEEFENLPLADKKEFSCIVLSKTAHFDYEELGDDELMSAASMVASLLDGEEDASSR